MKDAGLRVRVEKELREEFVATCRQQGLVAAAVLRDFMRDYVARERGGRQGSLFARGAGTEQPSSQRRG